MNSSICALGGMHQKNFEMRNFKKILLKIENVEKMHQKYLNFSILVKKMKSLFLHFSSLANIFEYVIMSMDFIISNIHYKFSDVWKL